MKTRLLLLIIVASLHLIPATVFASHGWIGFFEGSFKGKFINAQTNQPLEGVVMVAAYRIGITSFVEGGTDTVSFKEDVSNEKGEFHLFPHVFFYPWPFTTGGESSYFFAYKPGFKFYSSSKDDLDKNEIIKLEPVASIYYPRHEELEKTKGQYLVDWQKTRSLKEMIIAEEKQLRQLERYPAGVIFKGFTDEKNFLIDPESIAVDRDWIYIGDGGFPRRFVRLSLNGDWVTSAKMPARGIISGGPIAVAIQKDGVVWLTYDNCLVQYVNTTQQFNNFSYLNCNGHPNFYPTNFNHRFQIDRNDNLHFVTTNGRFPPGVYVMNKEGSILSKHISENKYKPFADIALDSYGNAYAVFIGGIIKFNRVSEPIKLHKLDGIREGFINVAVDDYDNVYVSLKDKVYILDKELNIVSSVDLHNSALGEIGIRAITVNKDGGRIYMIDSIYNRILAYDLKNKRWVAKQ